MFLLFTISLLRSFHLGMFIGKKGIFVVVSGGAYLNKLEIMFSSAGAGPLQVLIRCYYCRFVNNFIEHRTSRMHRKQS